MRPEQENVLVICDGGIPSLVCCMLALNPEAVVAWLAPAGSEGVDHSPVALIGAPRRSAVEAQADLLGLRGVEIAPMMVWDGDDFPTIPMLLLATQVAARLGCSDVVWPIVSGPNLDELASATEQARLVSRLTMLPPIRGQARSGRGSLIRVHTPLADLTPQQVAELALDLDAPVNTCWWRRAGDHSKGEPGSLPAWVGEARLLWEGALKDAAISRGHADPLRFSQAG